ncbi:sporulation protein YjcZ [Paenibacillus sp. GCM10027626]
MSEVRGEFGFRNNMAQVLVLFILLVIILCGCFGFGFF